MESLRRSPLLPLVFLLLLCGFLFFYRLGEHNLSSSHEARAAQNAQSILLHDDWLLPQLFDRQVELQKPPLYYWLVALLAQWQGGNVDAWAVRLPASLAALGCVLLVFGFCQQRGRPLAGFLAAAMLATFVHFTWLARVARIDMPLSLTTATFLLAFWIGKSTQESEQGQTAWRWLLPGYMALGLGLLLKGPIALVLPAAVILCWMLFEFICKKYASGGQTSESRSIRFPPGLWWGLPLALAIALPWFWLANVRTRGEFFAVFFWYHNFARGFGGAEELAEHPWWFYLPSLARDFLPWSPLLLLAGWIFFRKKQWQNDSLAAFGFIWFVSITLLLSCFRFKRADYLLPAYPGAALFLGCVVEQWWRKSQTVSTRFLTRYDRVDVGRFGFTPPSPPCEGGYGGVNPNQNRTLPINLILRNCFPLVWLSLLLCCVLGWGYFVTWVIPAENAQLPQRQFAQQVRSQTGDMVILFRVENHELSFHLGPPIDTILEWENLDRWLKHSPSVHVLMPAKEAQQRAEYLHNGKLQVLLKSQDFTSLRQDRPLVLLKAAR